MSAVDVDFVDVDASGMAERLRRVRLRTHGLI